MISNDAPNLKYIDNFTFIFAIFWICALEKEKKKKSGIAKSKPLQ